MTKEEIKTRAKRYRNRYIQCRDVAEVAFTAGAEWAMKEMEKEAQEFAEWALLNYFGCSDKHKIWWEDDFEKQYTAKELYQIFKQQKP